MWFCTDQCFISSKLQTLLYMLMVSMEATLSEHAGFQISETFRCFDSPCMRPFTQVSHFYVYMVSFCWECNIVGFCQVILVTSWTMFPRGFTFYHFNRSWRECVRITFISKSFCWLIMNFKCSCHILNFNCPSDSVWAFVICWSVNFCWAYNSTNINLIFRQCFLKNRITSNVYDCCEC